MIVLFLLSLLISCVYGGRKIERPGETETGREGQRHRVGKRAWERVGKIEGGRKLEF